jgi:hypothetical protein
MLISALSETDGATETSSNNDSEASGLTNEYPSLISSTDASAPATHLYPS